MMQTDFAGTGEGVERAGCRIRDQELCMDGCSGCRRLRFGRTLARVCGEDRNLPKPLHWPDGNRAPRSS